MTDLLLEETDDGDAGYAGKLTGPIPIVAQRHVIQPNFLNKSIKGGGE